MHVVFIHGPTAAGKYTVGTALSELTGLPLFHNHLTVDLVATLFPFGSEPFRQLREQVWEASFVAAAEAGRSFIFTFAPEASVDPSFIGRLEEVVAARGGRIVFVELTCAEDEAVRRAAGIDRAAFGKLRDQKLYRDLRAQGAFNFPPLPTPMIRVATDEVEPTEAALLIREALESAVK